MKPLAVSLLVHEEPDVLRDQIQNINAFMPGALVVVHVNANFLGNPDDVLKISQEFSNVLVNPTRMLIAWSDLIQAHVSNFKFLCNETQNGFDYFCLHASNDMFVSSGVEAYVRNHACGVNTFVTFPGMWWTPRRRAEKDSQLHEMMKHLGASEILGSQPEGTFYSREVFQETVNVIDKYFNRHRVHQYFTKDDNDHNNTIYAREEVYFPTIANSLVKSCAFPYLFSEVMLGSPLTLELIDAVRNKSLTPEYCLERRLLRDPTPMYDVQNLFAVKRIPRRMNDPLRQHIRGLTNGSLPSTTSTTSPDSIR